MQIITAEQRMAEKRGHKIVICGQSGVGKTTLAKTLDPATTLFMDLEAGDSALEGHPIDVIRPRTWQECRDFACFLGGGNPALNDELPYSNTHYQYVCDIYGDPQERLSKYETIFVDSITVAGRLCFQYCENQPENRSDRTGKLDTRACYGMHGREMMAWLTQLQHIREKNVIFVGILDGREDDVTGRMNYSLQIEGSKTGRELPGIVDELLTMSVVTFDDGSMHRALICSPMNEWGYPAKDRSGRLDPIEKPHLGELIQKMSSGNRKADVFQNSIEGVEDNA